MTGNGGTGKKVSNKESEYIKIRRADLEEILKGLEDLKKTLKELEA